MSRNETKFILTKFNIVRLRRPSDGVRNTRYWFTETTGIHLNDALMLTPKKHHQRIVCRNRGPSFSTFVTDNVDVIGEYKSDDIVKSKGAYIKIKHLEIGDYNLWVVGEDLGSGLERRYPLTMRAMKVYTLSDRIKKRLVKQKVDFLEKKKSWAKQLKEMIKARTSQTHTARHLSPVGKYQAVRRKK